MDDDQTIYVADLENDRIIEWQCNAREGRIVAGGNGTRRPNAPIESSNRCDHRSGNQFSDYR